MPPEGSGPCPSLAPIPGEARRSSAGVRAGASPGIARCAPDGSCVCHHLGCPVRALGGQSANRTPLLLSLPTASGDPVRRACSDGQAIPYDTFDLSTDSGQVNAGTDHDTTVSAMKSIRRWRNGVARTPARVQDAC
ncbi:ISAzo13-like element transposase-related protein [Nonomuraea jabiensis]|uniref:ISAzo13-like element transposase-related protein n=1 Tax=Nonomuraea jabiensis TaxID=882448 RepID=UPI003F4E0B88